MAGERDLSRLLRGLRPRLYPDRYAFAAVVEPSLGAGQFALVREGEGLTSIHPDSQGNGRGSAWRSIRASMRLA
ncbi:ACT domain-containing protein [Sphingomonas sediminicola]|uniref:ACT domain-containing protein n=1 Tax=Sphingomonas sediminicola TaxID=386874 RepID=UPI001CA740F9